MLVKLAWRNVWRNRRRSLITICATAVAVILCLFSNAFSDGWFGEMIVSATRYPLGHVQVHAPGYLPDRPLYETLADGDAVLEAAAALPRVAAAPRVYGFALVGVGDRSGMGAIVGIDPVAESAVSGIEEAVENGRPLPAKAAATAVIGVKLAKKLGAKVGDELLVLTEADDGFPGEALYRICGIATTGDPNRDRTLVLLHIDDARQLMALEGRTHEVVVVSADVGRPEPVAAALTASLGDSVEVKTWRQLQPFLAEMMQMAEGMVWLVLVIVYAIAGLGIANTVLMSVMERNREIGVMMAIGLKPRRVVSMILLENVALTLVAAVGGGALAFAAISYWLVNGLDLSGFISGLSMEGFTVSPLIHPELTLGHTIGTFVVLIVISTLSALWPAVRAARLDPARAIRT